jgi:hypothetical protein
MAQYVLGKHWQAHMQKSTNITSIIMLIFVELVPNILVLSQANLATYIYYKEFSFS